MVAVQHRPAGARLRSGRRRILGTAGGCPARCHRAEFFAPHQRRAWI